MVKRHGHARVLFLAVLVAFFSTAHAQEKEKLTFGIVLDGPSNYLDQRMIAAMKEEIVTLLEREYEVYFPDEKMLDSQFSLDGIRQNMDRLLADGDVDIVLCLGVLSSMEASMHPEGYDKPVFAPYAIGSGLPIYPVKDGGSGVPNFNYLSTPNNLAEDLAYMGRIAPGARVHIVVFDLFVELIPGMRAFVARTFQQAGMEATLVPCQASADEVLAQLPADAEMAYVTPLLQFDQAEKEKLYRGLADRRIKSFSLMGREEVTLGALAGLKPESDYVRWFRRLALNIQRVLLGEPAATLPVVFKETGKLVINMETARKVGWYPNWALQVEAELLNEEPEDIERRYDLTATVRRALAENLDVQASARDLELGQRSIEAAKANRKPSVTSNLTYLQVDEDSAAASLGSQPENETTASLNAEQLIFGDQANALVAIQQRLMEARRQGHRIVEMDTVLTSANRFLNYLKARTLYRIQRENLELTNSNLETAKIRNNIGIASPAEVYRWQARKATDQLNALTAKNQAHVALNALNQILNERQEMLMEAAAPDRSDKAFITGGGQLNPYVANAADFEVFRQFMVDEGLANSPELAQLDALIAAKEREVLAGVRSYYLPTVSLRANLEHELDRRDSAGFAIPGLPDLDFPQADDTRWNAALNFRLPLYSGGARKASLGTDRSQLAQLRLRRDSVAQKIELRVRSSMQQVATTLVGIQLRADAAEATGKNLELVEDAYAKGVAASIDLLDAQNAALVAREAAANAEFDFFLALMESQRAVASYSFLNTPEERSAFFRRLDEFFQKYR